MEPSKVKIVTIADFPNLSRPKFSQEELEAMKTTTDALWVMKAYTREYRRCAFELLELAKARYPNEALRVECYGEELNFIPGSG